MGKRTWSEDPFLTWCLGTAFGLAIGFLSGYVIFDHAEKKVSTQQCDLSAAICPEGHICYLSETCEAIPYKQVPQ
jgi:hypothetical protein